MNFDLATRIIAFQPCYQNAARTLVLNGLTERFGTLGKGFNTDLDNIADSYGDGYFLLALCDNELAGTGAIVSESPGVMRVVRMSTRASMRKQGIGAQVLNELLRIAHDRGCHQVVLETTVTWKDAVQFYLHRGFRLVGESDGDAHFVLDLPR